MESLLIIRERIIRFYKRFEPPILFILRFILGLYIFSQIHGIGHVHEILAGFRNELPFITLLMAIAFAVLPLTLSYLLIILDVTVQYSASIEVAAAVFVFLVLVLLFYARLAVKESIFIILTILAYRMGLPFLIPLIAGLYFSMATIVPVAIGLFIAHFVPVINELMRIRHTAEIAIAELPDVFTDLYTSLTAGLVNNGDWVFVAFIYAMVIILVHIVSRLAIDFAKEIAIALGAIFLIFGYIIGRLAADINVNLAAAIILILLCAVIAEIVRLFDPILDYGRAENVQFEDENNYYYVRVVPKINLTRQNRVVRRIRPDLEEDED